MILESYKKLKQAEGIKSLKSIGNWNSFLKLKKRIQLCEHDKNTDVDNKLIRISNIRKTIKKIVVLDEDEKTVKEYLLRKSNIVLQQIILYIFEEEQKNEK